MNSLTAILDYGCGNHASIINVLNHLGHDFIVIDSPCSINKIDRLVLPGVGSFRRAMENIKRKHFDEFIFEFSVLQKPMLGICLGMQLLGQSSTEDGFTSGLSLFDAKSEAFSSNVINMGLKIPHVGFNNISINKSIHNPLFRGFYIDEPDFYFTHSYRMSSSDPNIIASTSIYSEIFVSSLYQEYIFGTQFHPEKSQNNGLKLFSNFLSY